MRLLIAGMAALAALAFAAPSFAQDETPATDPAAAPAPAPTAKPKAKPKHVTAASCHKMKSAASRNACLKKMHAQATPKAAPTKVKKKKTAAKKTTAAANPDVGQLAPPAAAPAPAASASVPAPSGGTVPVPPLPQKTI